MDWLDQLNPAQRLAVTTTDGPVLIAAGPGSGKTRVIVHRVAYLVQSHGVAPWNILAVTFTNKAAKEMRERLDGLLSERQARAVTVGTFHATCARWLRIDGEQVGLDPRFTIYDDGDQIELVKQAIRHFELDEKQYQPRRVLSAISGAKSELISPERYAERADGLFQHVVSRVYERYQELLDENHALDFDDLLGKVVELFSTRPDVLERYQDRFPYLMVDEFQDTSLVQYELARLLGKKHRNVCVVGDEDQSIYGWRKADVRNLQHFERDFPELKIVMLEQNYRSTQTILDIATSVIAPNENRKPKQLWTSNPRGVRATLYQAYDERDEALFVVRKVEELRRAGARYDDVAVTYRTNAQSRALEDALVRYGVPYRLVGGTRFYERREIKDVVAYLRLLGNPADGVSFSRIVNVPARGLGAKTVSDLQLWAARLALPLYDVAKLAAEGTEEIGRDGRIAPVVPMAARPRMLLGKFISLVEDTRERLANGTLGEAVDFLLEKIEYKDHLNDGTEEGKDRWQNVLELRTKLGDFDHLAGDEALRAFLEEATLVQAVDSLDGAEGGAITLITLHAAKGLEFPNVFIIGLEEGICPHSLSAESAEQLEEERRLLYVGVTRAEQRLYLVHAKLRSSYQGVLEQVPSRFLLDIPSSLVDMSSSHAIDRSSGVGLLRGASGAGWGRGDGSRPRGSSRGGGASRSSPPAAPFRPSARPGRGGDAWPQVPAQSDPYAELDVGVDPGHGDPGHGDPGLSDPGLNDPGLYDPGLYDPGLSDLGLDGGARHRPTQRALDLGLGAGSTSPAARPARTARSGTGDAGTGNGRREARFGRGQRVVHPEYGAGTVIASSVVGAEELVLVTFDMRPDRPKNLSLAIHRLEPA